MAKRNYRSDFTRGRMSGKQEEGHSLTSVAEEYRINKSVVSHAWKAVQSIKTNVKKVGGCRPRKTTAVDD
ncbi:uncharacterized protein TNCV_4146841 [Trichonephila clavipes]|nr:uncharacterized protein TNCV_4146841 [Trichonephila clavipes]